MRFEFIKSLHLQHPIAILCRLLGVSRSGFYAWRERTPSERRRRDRSLKDKIAAVWERSGRIYGSPRVHAELRAEEGITCSRKRVERLMRELGTRALGRSWRRCSLTRREVRRPVAPDLVRHRWSGRTGSVLRQRPHRDLLCNPEIGVDPRSGLPLPGNRPGS